MNDRALENKLRARKARIAVVGLGPDGEAQQKFRDVTAAYEVLSDPQKRRIVEELLPGRLTRQLAVDYAEHGIRANVL